MNELKTNASIIAEIDELVNSSGTTYMDAAVHWCAQNNVEIELLGSILKKDSRIKMRLTEEAEALSMLKTKTERLDI